MFWPFSLFKKEETVVVPVSEREGALNEAQKKLERLVKKPRRDHIRKQVGQIFRDFVKAYYRIEYEFTYEELEKEMQQKRMKQAAREKILLLIGNLKEVSYSDEIASEQPIEEIPQNFLGLLEILKK